MGMHSIIARAGAILLILAPRLEAQTVCPRPWTLQETLRVGSVDGNVTLNGVSDLAIARNGEILLTQYLLPEITVLTPEGRFARTIGRAGEGPGEFMMAASSVGFRGDTLWASDFRRMNFFGADERPLHQVRFRAHVPEWNSVYSPRRLLADGSFLGGLITINDADGKAFSNRHYPILRFSAAGEILDTIALLDWTDRAVQVRRARGDGFYPYDNPLKEFLLGVTGIDHILAASGAALALLGHVREEGPAPTFDLLWIGIRGDTLMKRSIPYTPRPITRAERNRLTEEFAGDVAGDYLPSGPLYIRHPPQIRERMRRDAREAITFPQFHPPVRQIIAGVDGTIWLLRELRPDRVDHWEIYDSAARLLGTVEIATGMSNLKPWAPRLRILRASLDELWGTTIDDLEVTYLHRYRVDRSCR